MARSQIGRWVHTQTESAFAASAVLAILSALAAMALQGAAMPSARAQTASVVHAPVYAPAWTGNVIVPQARAYCLSSDIPAHAAARHAASVAARATVQIVKIDAGVVILEQVATTTLDITLANPGSRPVESELLVPVPDGAAVRGFDFSGKGAEPSAKLLPKDEAQRIYREIVARVKDPALLEFAGYRLVRSSVFPVPANGTLKVRLTYEHLLSADGDRVDYVLPRSESLDYRVPWSVSVKVASKRGISTVYSPSHRISTNRAGGNVITVRTAAEVAAEPGAFRLSYLIDKGSVTASLLAYPDAKTDGGYFLLMAGLPAVPAKDAGGPAVKREVTLVLDRSGSMAGEKFEQARAAARQVLGSLSPGEAFNILAYDDTIWPFAESPVVKTAESFAAAEKFLDRLAVGSGTNIHDALLESLRPAPREGTLPLVLFITDGLPTVGQTSETAIRAVASQANPHRRRVFTFGVGYDVNTPLLDAVATETRATSTYVLPKESVEVKVAATFKRLVGPTLADPKLTLAGPDSDKAVDMRAVAAPSRIRDLMPGTIPDLFEGDSLIVLGRYSGTAPLDLALSGSYLGKPRTFRFKFDLDGATTRNAFVPRLWASRKIAVLVDAVRALGADRDKASFASAPSAFSSASRPASAAAVDPKSDPRLKELVDSIVRLSTEFGVLTEYTAFLALEGTDLTKRGDVLSAAAGNFYDRAIQTRVGAASVNQSLNYSSMRDQTCLNVGNGHWDARMEWVAVTTVRQINDCAYYKRGERWVDSRLVENEKKIAPKKTIEFGSDEFYALVDRLAKQGRQGTIALAGDILLEVDGEAVLVKGPRGETPAK